MSPTNPTSEQILVLYGSQTGNSEQAAKEFANLCENATAMELDDFLELHKAPFTSVLVIVVSSYGVGGAPLGAQRFRQVCDHWLEHNEGKPLEGLQYAMCGLGDSKFTTFFENPKSIDEALRKVGAKRIGDLGKADASGDQESAILKWRANVLKQVQSAASNSTLTKERLAEMQSATLAVCSTVIPGFKAKESKRMDRETIVLFLTFIVALVATYFGQDYLSTSVGKLFQS